MARRRGHSELRSRSLVKGTPPNQALHLTGPPYWSSRDTTPLQAARQVSYFVKRRRDRSADRVFFNLFGVARVVDNRRAPSTQSFILNGFFLLLLVILARAIFLRSVPAAPSSSTSAIANGDRTEPKP
jgi:hypothetical protein